MPKPIDMLVDNAISGRGAEVKRATAVAAALELIFAKVGNAPANNGQLAGELLNLSKYADQIEAALKEK